MKGNSDAEESLQGFKRCLLPYKQKEGTQHKSFYTWSRDPAVEPATMKGNSGPKETLMVIERCRSRKEELTARALKAQPQSYNLTFVRGLEALLRNKGGKVFTRKVCRTNIHKCVLPEGLEEARAARNAFRLRSCR
jgi:hypothetical protein